MVGGSETWMDEFSLRFLAAVVERTDGMGLVFFPVIECEWMGMDGNNEKCELIGRLATNHSLMEKRSSLQVILETSFGSFEKKNNPI